ncbi:MAG: AAA family ATPase [Paraglaciecola polaris]|uniref:AAA family ATPase n=1 Tax=Paraglaciecola polaris TaxID=222814 RepID=UPI0030020DA7
MSIFEGNVQIRKIRKRGAFGGVIFSAVTLDEAPKRFVVKANWQVASSPSLFQEHHIWHVKGQLSTQTISWSDGTKATEKTITPESLRFVKASHGNLKRLLAESDDFKGISEVKAEKLVRFFGDELFQIARDRDIQRLLPIIGESLAERLVTGLQKYEELGALQLLDELGVPPNIGGSVINIWKEKAYSHIKKNPYFLTAFMADLNAVDAYAIDRLGMDEDCPERLIAYTKQVMFNAFPNGHTCLPISKLKYQLNRLLKSRDLAAKAIEVSVSNGELLIHDSIAQVKSMDIVESSIASIVKDLSQRKFNDGLSSQVVTAINEFERGVGFPLTEAQKDAVLQSCQNSLTLLTGGAGCGKTTVIEAICFALERLNQTSQIILMALSGKAAQRITEATGRDAMTIAAFMYNMDVDQINDDAVIIVDEASMVDVLSLLKILKRIPKRGRIILTGDQEQLPPVGIGLGLHLLVKLPLPNPHLNKVKRQSEESGIPSVANAIRCYADHPTLIPFTEFNGLGSGVSFIECSEHELQDKCIEVYRKLGGDGSNNDVLILSPVKHLVGGVANLNALIYDKFSKGVKLTFDHKEFGHFNHHILGRSLRVGELIMYKRNDYEKDIRNGSVGRVIGQKEDGIEVDFEGNVVTLTASDLKNLEHAYAMTVHKSQGSQYGRVIVAMRESGNLDRHLIYTAVTRAKYQVVFVGCQKVLYSALGRSNALKRHTFLSEHLSCNLT